MALKKPTQKQLNRVIELFTKLTNGEINEQEYIKLIKEDDIINNIQQ